MPENRLALKSLLDSSQTIVVEAESGNEALKLALEHPYALILLDVQMPDMDGIETAILLRLNPKTRDIPIIFVTAFDQKQEFMFKGYEAGAVDYIVKPVDPQVLKSKVQVFCQLHHLIKVAQISSQMDEGLVKVGAKLLSEKDSPEALNDSLQYLLQASDVSRVYIFENFQDTKDGLCMRQIYEVCAPGIEAQITNPLMLHLPYKDGFSDWPEKLSQGMAIYGRAETFPEEQKKVFQDQKIFSILIIPIMVDRGWYGFIGFDHCYHVREWQEKDIQLLRTTAEMIGTHFHRLQMEKDLRQSEEKYRALFESSQDAIAMLAPPSWGFIDCNPATVKMFEVHDKAEFCSLAPWKISPEFQPDGRSSDEKGREMIETAMREGSHFFEWAHKLPKGKELIVTVLLARTTIGDQTLLQSTMRDVTRQKQIEKELRENEERFRTITSVALDAIMLMDENGNISFWNPAAEKMFGYKAEDVLGKELHRLLAPSRYHDAYAKGFAQFQKTGLGAAIGKVLELEAIRKDGTEFPIELSVATVKRNDQWHAVGVMRDITGRKQMENKLHQTLKELTEHQAEVIATNLQLQEAIQASEVMQKMDAALVNVGSFLLSASSAPEAIQNTMECLLEASEVSRVYLFENFLDSEKGLCIRQTHEACAEGVKPQIQNPFLQRFPYSRGFSRWQEAFSQGDAVWGNVIELPKEEYEILKKQGVVSFMAIPIFVGGEWHGFIGFDQHFQTREWKNESFRLLRTAADMVGAFFYRQQVEKRLREAEKRFMDVFYTSNDAILLIDGDTFVDCNDATAKMLGSANKEEFLMTHPSQLSPPHQPDGRKSFEKANEMIATAFKNGFHRFEWIHRKVNGEDFPVEVSLVPVVVQGKTMLQSFWRDLTELKRNEKQLQEATEKMRLLAEAIDNADELVVITDANLLLPGPKIEFVNNRVDQITGYSREELLGKTPRIFQGSKTNKQIRTELKSKLLRGEVFHGETTNCRKDRSEYLTSLHIYPLKDEKGTITHYVSVQRDITEQKAMESKLALSSKMESIGQLASGIAHEINTPTQFIGDNIAFLQNNWPAVQKAFEVLLKLNSEHPSETSFDAKRVAFLSKEAPQALSDAFEGVQRITAIVKAMREFAHPHDVKASADINHALESTVTVARNEWKYVADMEMKLDPSLHPVSCFIGDLNQVFLNLIVNAAQAIGEKVGKTGDKGKIWIRTMPAGKNVRIEIEDNGPGIPEGAGARIFDPFFTTKGVGKGTGQGLYISHQIIEQKHGGHIGFESKTGEGTKFYIELPTE